MRKKSHISLAKYIVQDLNTVELSKHKKAFYMGSILPDCKPSFLTTKHEFNGTFDKITDDIKKLSLNRESVEESFRVFFRKLGEIIHYVADYFTLPHNTIFEGNLKDHCIYEKHLKHSLKEYINSKQAVENTITARQFNTADALCDFIKKSHEEYLKMKRGIQEDCRYIVALCHQVATGIMTMAL